jgi:hypothetical protein
VKAGPVDHLWPAFASWPSVSARLPIRLICTAPAERPFEGERTTFLVRSLPCGYAQLPRRPEAARWTVQRAASGYNGFRDDPHRRQPHCARDPTRRRPQDHRQGRDPTRRAKGCAQGHHPGATSMCRVLRCGQPLPRRHKAAARPATHRPQSATRHPRRPGPAGCSSPPRTLASSDSDSRGFPPTPKASNCSIRASISADGGTVRLTA